MLVATRHHLYGLDEGQGPPWKRLSSGEELLGIDEGWEVSAVAAGNEIALLEGKQVRWLAAGIREPITSLLLLAEEPLRLLVGTEGAHLYLLAGDGSSARRLEGFDELECRRHWCALWGGPVAVRSLVRRGNWIYADVDGGTLMRSSDRGLSWEPVQPGHHEEAPQGAVPAVVKGRVYAHPADAGYVSEDRGHSWQHRAKDLVARYGRTLAVHPQDPVCLLATFSQGSDQWVEGRLCRSEDGGRTWTYVTEGFPAGTRVNTSHFQIVFSAAGTAWAAVKERLYRSADRGVSWAVAWAAPAPIVRLACARAC